MSSKENLYYLNGVVICHGKTERCLARFVFSNLHLRMESFAKDKGEHSIQITALKTLLNRPPFNNANNFLKTYDVESSGKGAARVLKNFKLFIIMDTDDCTEEQGCAYKSKKMFEGHWLYDYIVPIYNSPKIEDVFVKAKVTSRTVKDSEKGRFYQRIFPINEKPLSDNSLVEVKTLQEKLKPVKSTNLDEFIDYCLSLLE